MQGPRATLGRGLLNVEYGMNARVESEDYEDIAEVQRLNRD